MKHKSKAKCPKCQGTGKFNWRGESIWCNCPVANREFKKWLKWLVKETQAI